ncbi:MAG TPA: aminotransferase class I/II-fold pyridoxal phosphate-dependent enzyme [Flavobacteriaceae bacterium]|nr:aminotransferase class I/II-fold pyridoxal phosphate-dependent enzyme [Flavobacteriaceae bacterium]
MISKANRLQTVQEYYFSHKLREVQQLITAGKSIINLGIGSPDMAAAPEVIKALTNATILPNATQYQSYQGTPELRNAISKFYQHQFKVTLNPINEILPLMGSKEGIMHISMAFLNPGDEVLIPNPGYPTYESVTKLVGAVPVFYELNDTNNWFPDLKNLSQHDLSKVKLIWVNYPHMPTGATVTHQQWKQLIDFAQQHQILVVNDNPYSFILNDEPNSILQVDGAHEVALELNSLSKTFNISGMRVGMVMGAAANIEAVLQVKSQMDSGMFLGIQHAAIAALQLEKSWFVNLNKIYKERRLLVWKLLDKLHCTYDKNTAGLFVWAKIPDGKDSEHFTDELLYQSGIFITPGKVFGSAGNNYIRVSLCASESDLNEVINRLKK